MATEMSPTQAAQILQGIGDYEERMSLRAGGMTLMVWGMAAAGIFFSYGTADPYLEKQGLAWMYAVLWLPFVLGGIVATGSLWRAHALSLRQEHDDKSILHAVVGVLGFFAIACLLFLGLDILVGVEWTVSSIMTVTNGLFAMAMYGAQWRLWDHRNTATLVAGLVMVLLGVAIGASGMAFPAADLVGGFGTGAAWFTAGILTYRRG